MVMYYHLSAEVLTPITPCDINTCFPPECKVCDTNYCNLPDGYQMYECYSYLYNTTGSNVFYKKVIQKCFADQNTEDICHKLVWYIPLFMYYNYIFLTSNRYFQKANLAHKAFTFRCPMSIIVTWDLEVNKVLRCRNF